MTKRDAVCEAALELFAENGIEATTTREIAERAGAAEGTLYRHFKGKEDLAESLYRRCADQLRGHLAAASETATAPAVRLEALVRGIFTFFDERPTSCTYLLTTQPGDPDEADEEASAPPLVPFADVLRDGIEQGTFRDVPVPLTAGWILSMVQRTVRFLKAGTLRMEKQAAIDRTVDAALRLVDGGSRN
ncbi:MAG: TetR/AcrR family transcriptional regulator [Salinivenus sp.]